MAQTFWGCLYPLMYTSKSCSQSPWRFNFSRVPPKSTMLSSNFIVVFVTVDDAVAAAADVASRHPGARHIPGGLRHVLPAHASLRRREVLPWPRSTSRRLAVQSHPEAPRTHAEGALLQRVAELKDNLLVHRLRRHHRQVDRLNRTSSKFIHIWKS